MALVRELLKLDLEAFLRDARESFARPSDMSQEQSHTVKRSSTHEPLRRYARGKKKQNES